MRIRFGLVAALLAAGVAMAGEAVACSILPPRAPPALTPMPGEDTLAFQERMKLHLDGFAALQQVEKRNVEQKKQSGLWADSSAIAVVEMKKLTRDVPTRSPMGNGSSADLKVVGWLKGPVKGGGKPKALTLAQTDYTSCGPMPMWDVFHGEPGDRFVVFFEAGKSDQADTREAMTVSEIVDPALIKALATKVR